MNNRKLVVDSSANMLVYSTVPFAVAPLKVITDEREFTDNDALDVQDMLRHFDVYKGRSKTSCPNPSDWLEAFGDADEVFCVTITSGLSGSYNAAVAAKQIYEADHPDRQVYVVDSLSAGPELILIAEKLGECMASDMPFQDICNTIQAYTQKTGLVFMLESLKNFAANGRISPAIAKIAGFLGIRIVGKASDKGQLQPLNKCRGEKLSLDTILEHLKQEGLQNGKVQIAHCENAAAALKLKGMIAAAMPAATVEIAPCRGLCSYYAEKGGLLVGFEKM